MRAKTSLLSRGRRRLVLALAVILAGAAAPSAVAQDPLLARVAFDSGGAMVKGTADEDWSYATVNTLIMPGDTLWVDEQGTLEVEMSGGTFLRMADGSKASIVSLPPSGVIEGWTGAFYVQRIARSSGSVIFKSPVADMHVQNDTQVRVDILTNGATTVSVRWGAVTIRTPGGQDTILQAGQRSYIDPGYLPSLPEPFDRGEEDTFDAWNRERAQLLAVGMDAIPTTVIKEAPVGAADLSTYGEWVTIEDDYYWRPTVVADYVPYRYGHWGYAPSIGYSWVGDYPFGYITSHYGRWRHHPSYGWCWRYRDVWSPAWVASYRVGPNFVWCPLDPWDRPVLWGNDFYYIGGLQFSVFASSYCGADYLFYGGRYINPFRSSIIRGVPTSQINIWNINIGSHRPHFPYPDRSIPVRDYAPRRSIRGPMALEREGTLARGRVERLESSIGRQRFETARADVRRSVRTPDQPSSREARARSVRLTPEAASVTPEARGRRLATTDIGGIRERGRAVDRSRSVPGARIEPGEMPRRGIDRGRGGEPSVRDRSVREAPESGVGGVPTGRSRGGRERAIRRTEETPSAPSSEPRSIAPDETPSFRGRGEGGGVRERTTREPVDVGGAETRTPSRGRGGSESPSIRRSEPSGPTAEPSPRSTESPRRTESPSIRRNEPSGPTSEPSPRSIESPRRTEAPSPRSIEAPQRPEAPSMRTPSHGRSSMRVEPQAPSRPDVISRGGPSPRSIEPPRAQAPQVMPRSMRSAPSVPQYSRPAPEVSRPSMPTPQVSRPSMPSPRSMEMPSPSPRMSSPDRGGRGPSMGEAPSIRGGSSHSGGRGMDGGGRSMGGGRSSRGR